jgi:hypothetical protein
VWQSEHEPSDRVPHDHGGERESVQRVRPARPALERPQQEERREQAQREHHRVAAGLLRPLDHERARDEEEAAQQSDASVEQPTREHDHERTREHCRNDGGEAERPLGVSGQRGPWLLDRVVQPVVALERADVRPGDLVGGQRLVDPQGRSAELHDSEHEGRNGHDEDVERERVDANALDESRPETVRREAPCGFRDVMHRRRDRTSRRRPTYRR